MKKHVNVHIHLYRIVGYFRWCKFSHKMEIWLRKKMRNLNFHNPRVRVVLAMPAHGVPRHSHSHAHPLTRAPLERLRCSRQTQLPYMEDLASFSIFYQTAHYTYVKAHACDAKKKFSHAWHFFELCEKLHLSKISRYTICT